MESKPPNPIDVEALQRQVAELQAQLAAAQQANVSGSGAAAQGDGTALGERSVKVDGHNFAPISTGTQIRTDGGAYFADSVSAGGHVIGRDLVQYVTQIIQSGEDPEEAKSVIAAYLQALVDDLAGLNLGEIDASAKDPKREPLQLADIYVPLDTTLHIPNVQTLEQWHAHKSERGREESELRDARPVSALEALAAHRALTLLGKPGSGKSTFGAYVVLALAQAWQGHTGELAKLGEHWTHGALLPVRVVLRRFAEQLAPGDKAASAGDLWAFIARDLAARGYGLCAEPIKYIQRIARERGALILLDGLDECGSPSTRQRVLAAVDEIKRSAGPKCRFLLTARPYAFPGGPEPAHGVYALADLGDEQIEQFIRDWYAALVTRRWLSAAEAERKMSDLLDSAAASRSPATGAQPASAHADGHAACQSRAAARRPRRPLQRIGGTADVALEPADRRRQGAATKNWTFRASSFRTCAGSWKNWRSPCIVKVFTDAVERRTRARMARPTSAKTVWCARFGRC